MKSKWFTHSYRRNLVDMHIDDSDPRYMSRYDPVKYVDNLILAGMDTAILYAGSCLGICYWPTKAGHMHSGLMGRDILKETIAECRRRGLRVNVYYNIWSRWAYDNYPEWRYRNGAGKGMFVESDHQRYGLCCSNTAYSDYVIKQIADLCENYDMDGLWIDMIGWFGGVCFCDACKARYQKETGKSFPQTIDWRNSEWREFQKHREAWYAGFAKSIRSTALRFKPEISVTFQSASWAMGWYVGLSQELYRQSDYLAGDFYGDPIEQSFVCKYLESLSENKPIEFMTSRCPTLLEHTTTKPKELLEAQAFASIANNAACVFIDAIDPDGSVHAEPYRTMRPIFAQTSVYEPFIGPQLRHLSDVAVYVDLYSLASMKDNGRPIGENSPDHVPVKELFQIARTLIHNNIPYSVATRKDLDALGRYQLLIIPDAFLLDKEEADAIRKYVADGGAIYVSKNTSLIHGDGDFLLSDVMGVSKIGETEECVTYLSPADGYPGLSPYSASSPLTIDDTQAIVNAHKNAEILATITLPYTPVNDPFQYSSAISNPPGRPTGWPALVRNRYGKGTSLYCAGILESMINQAQSDVFAGLIRSLLPKPPYFVTDAPKPIEIIVYEDEPAKRLVISILNFQSELPNLPVNGIHVAVRMDGRPFRYLKLVGKQDVPCEIRDGFIHFTVAHIDTYQMYLIGYC